MMFWKKKKEKTRKSTLIIIDTNIPLHCTKFKNLEFLDKLEAEVFIPWAVCKELITSARMAEEDKEILESEDYDKYVSWEDSLGEKLTPHQVRARKARVYYAEDACEFVQQKINHEEWKTIGTYLQLKKYIDGFQETLKEQVRRNRADLEVLACCFVAAERYKKKDIILMSMDGRLRNVAEEFGIRVHRGPRDSSLF